MGFFLGSLTIGTGVIAVAIVIGIAVLEIVSSWRVFVKADEPGWKIFIPVYGEYMQYKIAGLSKLYWVSLILSIVVNSLESPDGASTFGSLIAGLGGAIVEVLMCISLAQSFGKSGWFGVGLAFLPMIFFPILAFGSAEYIGEKA